MMYAVIRIHIDNMDDPQPDVTIADLDENRDSLEFRMWQSFSQFLGWRELIDFMTACPEVEEQYNQTGYLMHYDQEAEPLSLDYWTIREV